MAPHDRTGKPESASGRQGSDAEPEGVRLLRELALAPGQVFTRQQLLDGVGTDIFVDERTIDVHMSWLRSKLREAGGPDGMIRTIYGRGYCFEVAS
ncbi:MAG: winged helix-turn-helix domain-containing protein [Thermomicrobiales bacterium]